MDHYVFLNSKISLLELGLNPKLHQSCGCQVPALYHRQLNGITSCQ